MYMSISQLSSYSVAANSADTNPQTKTEQAATVAKAGQNTHNKTFDKNKSDAITVSATALKMAAAPPLTGHALAQSLKQHGYPISEIAVKMNLSTDAAAKLLGAQETKTTPQITAAAETPQQSKRSATSSQQTNSTSAESPERPETTTPGKTTPL